MPHSNGSALALASRLRKLSDPELLTLLRLRDVREAGIRDFFDLADKLLDRAAIQATLTQLDRRTLHTLSVIAELSTNGEIADAAKILKGLICLELIQQNNGFCQVPDADLLFDHRKQALVERLVKVARLQAIVQSLIGAIVKQQAA